MSERNPDTQMHVSTGEETSDMVDAESSANTQQMSPNVNGETESIAKDEDVVEIVSSENGGSVSKIEQPGIDRESRSLQGGHMDYESGSLASTDVYGIPDSGNQTEDAGKEDMFVDAPEELSMDRRNIEESEAVTNSQENMEEKLDSHEAHSPVVEKGSQNDQLIDELAQLRAMLDKTFQEKEILVEEYKEERETLAKELADLHQQLEGMTSQQSLLIENGNGMVDSIQKEERIDVKDDTYTSVTPLQVMISDCSKFTTFLKNAVDERLQSEEMVKQLNTILSVKDQEIEDLSAKVGELSVSHNVVISFLDSLQKVWSQTLRESSEVSHERDMHLEVASKNLLDSLTAVVKQEDLLDDSLTERLSLVEKGTSMMVTNYNQFLSEINRLGQCLTEVRSDFVMPEVKEYGIVFDIARNELLECRNRELDIVEKLNNIEAENRKLLEQLNTEKEKSEVVNAEMGKTRMDLEQEKTRSATVKEKLSMAVTKGKALVQQRDSLKQSLAEKTNELDRCLLELQEKASGLEAAEVRLDELVRSQNLVVSLQESLSQKDLILKDIEETLSEINTPDELQSMGISERVRWILDQNNRLEVLSQRDLILKEIEETLSEIIMPDELQSMGISEKVRWILDQNNRLEVLSQKDLILKEVEETLSEINMPDELQPMDIIEKVKWLLEQKNRVEVLTQKDLILKEIEETLSVINIPDELQSLDLLERVRWLLDQKNKLEGISFEFCKLKDLLSSIDVPETILSSSLESQINWVQESFLQAKDNIIKLQGEVAGAQEAVSSHESELAEARTEIDHLTTSLSAEKRENSILQMRLEDLSYKYDAVSEKELQIASEKDETIRIFLEASGMDNQDGFNHSDMVMLVGKCIQKIKDEASASFKSLCVEREQFERMQSLLYVRSQELMLWEDILKGDMLERSEVTDLSKELQKVSQEIITLKDENDALLRDLERSEDKSALLREKLSLAVKKGKGLVQEREGLKHSLTEKSKEIEKLKHELQQQVSLVTECRDQMTKLSGDLEHIPKLESDLLAMKDQRDQLEQFLLESNSMLQRVIESIESIVLPVDAVFEEPVDKVKWLAECFHDYQVGKSRSEQELETANQEVSSLATKLENAYTTIKTLEDVLSKAKNDLSLLAEEKEDIQVGKAVTEKELEKAKDEVGAQATKFAEVFATIKSLEDALSLAENNVVVLTEQKTAVQFDKTCVEAELEKAKEETSSQANKLAEAYMTIKSLEDALSEVEKNASVFTEEKNEAQVAQKKLENELEKVKDDAAFQASKVADAYTTIKSLEDALAQAENNNSVLVNEKKNTEQEISTLNAKLKTSMEELAGTHGNLEGQSVELLGNLNHVQVLIKDGALLSSLTQGFKKNLESLRHLHLILEGIQNRFVEEGSEWLHVEAGTKRDPYQANLFSADLDNLSNGIMDNSETRAADLDDISSCFAKIVEGLNMKDKLIIDKFEGFSCTMDEHVAALSRALQATMSGVASMLEHLESLKQKVTNLEAHKQDQDGTVHTLQNAVTMLLSACKNAVEELQFEVDSSGLGLSSNLEPENLNSSLFSGAREAGGDAVEDQQESFLSNEYVKAAKNLLLATRKVRAKTEQFENIKSASETTIKDLKNELEEKKRTIENFLQERDLIQNRALKLEIDLEAVQNFNNEMKLKLDDYHVIEAILRERETELSALRVTIATKQQEANGQFLLKDEAETLFEKLNRIEIPFRESEFENPEPYSSATVKKLFYIVDNVTELQLQVQSSSLDNEELQSSVAAHVNEIHHLKKEAESIININQDVEKAKNDLAELASGLEKIIQKLGRDDLVEDKKAVSVRNLFPLLEKLVTDLIWDSENSKTKVQELSAKLHGNQKLVDDLSAKIAVLEDSTHGRLPPSNTVLERSIFEGPSLATGSEITELESTGPLGRNSTSPPIPSAAHVRTLRKGSSDHLALNIDVESERLINPLEPDDDKGHAFKSLNTSGLIPKQGKVIADRIDGIWVTGGRVLMSRPRARIGLVAYWLVLHIWLLGTIF